MKIRNILLFTTMVTVVLLLGACGGGNSEENTGPDGSTPGQDMPEALSAVEIEGLLYMREEEELARDLYLDIYAAKDNRLNVFKNISDNAETQHAVVMLVLLDRYGLEDPSTGQHDTYTNPELQNLYNQLFSIAIGSDDYAALMVGALVEETDIGDILAVKLQVSEDHQDIISTYDNLLCGSRNHLRAFAGQIERITGQPYATQVHTLDAEVTAILNSPQERCGQ